MLKMKGNNIMMKKQGFTLAEVVITLAVLGVMATILLPALMNNRPNQEMIMLKKVYYLTGRTVNELINDEDFYPEVQNENNSGFSNTARTQYHGVRYGEGSTDGANGKFCGLFSARMNLRGPAKCSTALTLDQGGNFTTADGVAWSLPINDFNKGNADSVQTIEVDVNGINKRPNCLESACNGQAPDRFQIRVDRYGVITVPDGIEQEYLALSDTTKTYQQVLAIRNRRAQGNQ